MMKLKSTTLSLVTISILGLGFSGCAPTYNIEPMYDKKTDTLSINNYKMNNIKQDIENSYPRLTGSVYETKKYKLGNSDCKHIFYQKDNAGTNRYYSDSRYEKIIENYAGGSCDVTSVGNLKFLSCGIMKNKDAKQNYFITTNTTNQYGYQTKEQMSSLSKDCFSKIKKHSISQAKKDGAEIKTYVEKSDLAVGTKVYSGIFTVAKSNPSYCVKTSEMKLFVDKDNNLKGRLSFLKKGKGVITPPLTGTITKFNAPKIIFNTTKYNDTLIEGTYSYNNKGCNGTFKATTK